MCDGYNSGCGPTAKTVTAVIILYKNVELNGDENPKAFKACMRTKHWLFLTPNSLPWFTTPPVGPI